MKIGGAVLCHWNDKIRGTRGVLVSVWKSNRFLFLTFAGSRTQWKNYNVLCPTLAPCRCIENCCNLLIAFKCRCISILQWFSTWWHKNKVMLYWRRILSLIHMDGHGSIFFDPIQSSLTTARPNSTQPSQPAARRYIRSMDICVLHNIKSNARYQYTSGICWCLKINPLRAINM